MTIPETLTVIGNDEIALELAGLAANAGRRVLWIQSERCHSSWIVAQALRTLVSGLLADLTPTRRQHLRQLRSTSLLKKLVAKALCRELQTLQAEADKLGISVLSGDVRFDNAGHLHPLNSSLQHPAMSIRGPRVIATGTRCVPLSSLENRPQILSIERLLDSPQLPRHACVLGGEGVGAGLAALLSLFGCQCRLINSGTIDEVLTELAIDSGVSVTDHSLRSRLSEFSPTHNSESIIDCRRQVGFTAHLDLPQIGVEPDEQGQLWCNDVLETWRPGVYGAGSVVGFSPVTTSNLTRQAMLILHHLDNARNRRISSRGEFAVAH